MTLRGRFLLPARVWMGLFFALPVAIVFAYSFLTRGDYGGAGLPWSAESFARLADPLYLSVLWRSVLIASEATVLCGFFGFPLALFIARAGKRRNLYLQLVLLPFWTSFLVRTYAWLFILRDTGLINTILLSLHIVSAPVQFLYNDGAVLLGLVYNFLPFFVLPMYASLERLDPALAEAAADLGATPFATLRRVIVPVSAPGIAAGAALVFVPCLGAYLTPDLLGGGKSVMLGNLIQNQFTTARDWPFGSAASIVLMVLSTVLLAILLRSGFAKDSL